MSSWVDCGDNELCDEMVLSYTNEMGGWEFLCLSFRIVNMSLPTISRFLPMIFTSRYEAYAQLLTSRYEAYANENAEQCFQYF